MCVWGECDCIIMDIIFITDTEMAVAYLIYTPVSNLFSPSLFVF